MSKKMKAPFLQGKIIYLTGMERSDLELLKKWINNEKVTYLLETGDFPPTIDRLKKQYDREINEKNDVSFIVRFKKNDKPIGWGGLYDIRWIKHSCELRFFIGEPKYWIVSAALDGMSVLMKYGFEKLNMNKIQAGANTENPRSWKMLERLGFVSEGTFRDGVFRNGKYYDTYMYSMLRIEYDKLYSIE